MAHHNIEICNHLSRDLKAALAEKLGNDDFGILKSSVQKEESPGMDKDRHDQVFVSEQDVPQTENISWETKASA